MSIFNKIIYFIGILVYLVFIIFSILFFDSSRRIAWILIFTAIIVAYYFIFIHTIKKTKDKHRIATKSILAIISLIWVVILFFLIKRWISSWQEYRDNIKREEEIKKEAKINEELNKAIKDLSYNLFNDKEDLATTKKDWNWKEYYLMNYIQDSYEWYASTYTIKKWKIAEPYIKDTLDIIKNILIQNYWTINENYITERNNYTTEDRLYWYIWILHIMLRLINNQQNIKDWLDYQKIITTKDKASDEYKMKTQYGILNILITLRWWMKTAEENKWYWDVFNKFPMPYWSGNPDVIL
jgi:ABC-type multidrug transport system fused ATPase/permease subunit